MSTVKIISKGVFRRNGNGDSGNEHSRRKHGQCIIRLCCGDERPAPCHPVRTSMSLSIDIRLTPQWGAGGGAVSLDEAGAEAIVES